MNESWAEFELILNVLPVSEVEILNNPLSAPESDHVTCSLELKVAT